MSEQSQAPVPPRPPAPPVPPVPQYGEYATPAAPPPPAAPGYTYVQVPVSAAGGLPEPARSRRTWDLVLTVVLLAVGFLGMLGGLAFAAAFGTPEFDQGLASQGIDVELDFGVLPQVIAISHVVLYLLAVGISIPLLVHRKIVVFWIPLTAGVIAALILWGGYFGVFFSAVSVSDLSGF